MNVQEFEGKNIFITEEFFDENFEKSILKEMPDNEKFLQKKNSLKELNTELINLFGQVLPNLSFEQEQFLFKKLNYFEMQMELFPKNQKYKEIFIDTRNTIFMCYIRSAIKYVSWKIALADVPLKYQKNKSFDFRAQMVSENYNALIDCISRFDWRRGYKFSTYLYRAFQKSSLNAMAKYAKKSAYQFNDEFGEIIDKKRLEELEFGKDIDFELADKIKKAINQLRPEEQEIFYLKHIHGMKTCRIAKMYNMTKQAMSYRLDTYKRKIINHLKPNEGKALDNYVY